MSKTIFRPIYGRTSACAYKHQYSLAKRKAEAQRNNCSRNTEEPNAFSQYENSDSDIDEIDFSSENLNTSINIVDYLNSRQINRKFYSIKKDYGNRLILSNKLLREKSINLENTNHVFCSQWLFDKQIVMGTLCKKLLVYDVKNGGVTRIPSLNSRRRLDLPVEDEDLGIHALQVNPSQSLLASVCSNTADVAVYKLPTFEPICVGQNALRESIHGMCWIDNEFLVTSCNYTKIALWKIPQDSDDSNMDIPACISPISSKISRFDHQSRGLTFSKSTNEVAALTCGNVIDIWDARTLHRKYPRISFSREHLCLAVQDGTGLYAIGCRNVTLLVDFRTEGLVKKIPALRELRRITSVGFYEKMLTMGTGTGFLMFYDVRADKYLESVVHPREDASIRASRISVNAYHDYREQRQDNPAIFTHCFDTTGTKLFTAGGPLSYSENGHYAAIWQ